MPGIIWRSGYVLQNQRKNDKEDCYWIKEHTQSFGGIGVFAIPEMGRFYRHVLIQKRYPHHGAVAFGHYGKALFEVFKFLGVKDIAYNQPSVVFRGRRNKM